MLIPDLLEKIKEEKEEKDESESEQEEEKEEVDKRIFPLASKNIQKIYLVL